MHKIGIIGAGSWGMALAIYLANQGNEVKVWSHTEEEKNSINNERKVIYITSYDSLVRDIDKYEDKSFKFIIADEAQYITGQTININGGMAMI